VHEPAAMNGLPIMEGLLQRVQHEAGMSRTRDPPAHDASGVRVDYEGHIDEAGPGCHVSEVRDPECIRPRRLELPVS
jgi:hypothetical protein